MELTDQEREQVAEILNRRANEIAGYAQDHRENPLYPERKGLPGSVDLALSLEITRLRRLANKIHLPTTED